MNNKELKDKLKVYEKYFTYNKPVPYTPRKIQKEKNKLRKELSNNGDIDKINNQFKILDKKVIYIYPIKVRDYLDFSYCVNCLLIEKNQIPDSKIISMSYLDFLFYLMQYDQNGSIYFSWFTYLMNMCLDVEIDDIHYEYEDNKLKLKLNISDSENNENWVEVDKDDFDEIKRIICYQNMIDYDDSYIDPEVKKAIDEAEEFKNRKNKKMCNFEEQISCVMIALGESDEEKIYDMSMRKFSMILRRYDHKLHYEIFKTASMSGFVEFKKDVDHWMSEIKTNKYADAFVEYDQFEKKIKSANS